MTTPHVHRVEVWNSTRTTKLGIIPLELISSNSSISEELNGDYSLTIDVDISYSGIEYLVQRNHIYIANQYSTLYAKQLRKFRIQTIKKVQNDEGSYSLNIFCEHITFDLLNEIIPITTTYASLNVENILTKILEGSSFNIGVVDRDNIIPEFTIGGKSRLESIKELVEKIPNTFLWVSDSGLVNIIFYTISSDPSARFDLSGGNMLSADFEVDSRRLVSRMYGVGGGDPRMNLSLTWHPIESIVDSGGGTIATIRAFKIAHSALSFTDITAVRKFYIVTRDGWKPTTYYNPVFSFDPQFDGPGTADKIVATADPAWSFFGVETEFAIFYSDDSGTTFHPIDYIDDREMYNQHGYLDGITDTSDEFTENLLTDPFFSKIAYVSGKHPSFNSTNSTSIGANGEPVFAENTDLAYVKNGTKSQKITTNKYGIGVYVDVPIYIKSNDSIYFSIKILVYIASGAVRFDIQESGGCGTGIRDQMYPPDHTSQPIFSRTNGKFIEVTFNGVKNEHIDTTNGKIRIFAYQHESTPATAVFYIDSIQVEPFQSASDSWIDGGTKKLLWDKCYDEQGKVREGLRTYSFKIKDLFAKDMELIGNRNQFDVSSVCLVKNSVIGVDERLICYKKVTKITDPSDVEVTLDNKIETTFTREAELYIGLSNSNKAISRSIGKIQSTKFLQDGNKKTVSIIDPTSSRSQPLALSNDVDRDGGYDAKIVWAGNARHGCQILDRLVVPAGRKIVFSFLPTESGQYNYDTSTVSGNRHFDVGVNIIPLNLPTELSGPIIMNDSAFLLEDETDTNVAIRFIKICLIAGTHPITGQKYQSSAPTYDRSTAFHSWIPPGSYDDLTLVAIGKATTGTKCIMYSGPLILFEVPLRRTHLRFVDQQAGSASLDISASTTGGISQHISPSGRVKVGSGPNEEIITIGGSRSAPSNNYNAAYRGIFNASEKMRYKHYIGEPVEEYQEGSTNGFTFNARPIAITVEVVHPTSITP